MPEARKRPCRICRRWFRPGPRAGDRQRACDAPECQAARRQKTQARWRKRNPGYAVAWRIDRRATQVPQPPEPRRRRWNMRKILLMAKRDYVESVRTKAFIIGLVVAPLLFGGGF